jgi:hypothetical protein
MKLYYLRVKVKKVLKGLAPNEHEVSVKMWEDV